MKLLNRIFSFISVFLLLFYQIAVPLTVFAQEATPSADISQSATDSAVIDTSTTEDQSNWQINADGSTTTKDPVTLNTIYEAPQNDKVTITFSKLTSPGKITIKEMSVSSLNSDDINPVTQTAYEITSDMENGTFEYTLTLPTPKTENVEVKASEDGQTFVTLGGVTAGEGVLTITGLNHFTIFVIAGTIASDNTVTTFDESGAAVVINEFVFKSSPDSDTEWLELFNRGEASVDLSGWRLEDANSLTSDDLDLSGTIPPGGILVFQRSSGWLNNDGDTIRLKDDESNIVDRVSYKDEPEGTVEAQDVGLIGEDESVGRTTDGAVGEDEDWSVFSSPTKGYNNDAGDTGEITFLNVGSIYPFESIHDGIDAISLGGTVNVAAGVYEEGGIEVSKEGVSIIGPGTGEGVEDDDKAFFVATSCFEFGGLAGAAFHLHADGITLSGLDIDADGCEHVVHVGGISGDILVAGVTVSGNAIHNGTFGVTISWGSSPDPEDPNTVSGNDIYENEIGVLLNSASNNHILDNSIHHNFDTGIKLIDCLEFGEGSCGEFGPPSNNLIEGNTIVANGVGGDTGISVEHNGEDNHANENIISGNGVGVINFTGELFDATSNWWGDVSGPSGAGPGEGDAVLFGNVLFEPWCADLGCGTLYATFDGTTVSIPLGSSDEDTPSFTFLEESTFEYPTDGGTSSVVFPSGTEVSRSDGGSFDLADLLGENVDSNSLAGLGTGVVADGALQWGLPDLELTFDPAITVSIFVGTALNGQTLNIVRSTTGDGGWTSDGIGPPTTCVVAEGLCTFTATKASFYAATHTPPSVSTQALSPASGSVPAPSCSDTKPGSAPALTTASAGTNNVFLSWIKATNPVTYYLITYGLAPGQQLYGNPNVGGADTTSYNVAGLSGGTTYYFKVRAGNGCAPGDFSNELSATPGGGFIAGPAAGFAPGVLGVVTEEESQGQIQGETTTGSQPSQTSQPQTASESPFNLKTVSIVVLMILIGFGIFKLVIK